MLKKNSILLLIFLLIFSIFDLSAQIFEDDFESYNVNEPLAAQAGDPWTTWHELPGEPEDPIIKDNYAHEGSQSVFITNDDNSILLLGDQIQGRYKLSFYTYVMESRYSSYRLMQDFSSGNGVEAVSVFFDLNGNGYAKVDGDVIGTFQYSYETWNYVENFVDLDNDQAGIFINGELVAEWTWTASGDEALLQLAALNFNSWSENSGLAIYYVDDVLFEQMPLGLPPENLTAEVNEQTITLNWDAPAEGTPQSYYIYRDGHFINSVTENMFEETISYPGLYTYQVKAYYTANGLSAPAGPVEADIAGGVERSNVLLEIGTGTWCGYCPGAAMGADDMVEAGHRVGVLEYHFGDPFISNDGSARISYYGINSYPTTVFDGVDIFSGGNPSESIYDTYLAYYEPHIAKRAIFTLDTDITQINDNEFVLHVESEQLWEYSSSNMWLRVALSESHIPFDWEEIMHEVNFVCRDMFPDAAGTEVTLENPGDIQSFDIDVTLSDDYVLDNCELVIYIQDDDTKEVLNTSRIIFSDEVGVPEKEDLKVRIYPNPASGIVHFTSQSIINELSIYDLSGQEVYEATPQNKAVTLHVDFLRSGLYLVRLTTDKGVVTQKLSVR